MVNLFANLLIQGLKLSLSIICLLDFFKYVLLLEYVYWNQLQFSGIDHIQNCILYDSLFCLFKVNQELKGAHGDNSEKMVQQEVQGNCISIQTTIALADLFHVTILGLWSLPRLEACNFRGKVWMVNFDQFQFLAPQYLPILLLSPVAGSCVYTPGETCSAACRNEGSKKNCPQNIKDLCFDC